MAAVAVAFQHHREDHRVSQAVGNAVLPAQGVGQCVNIPHIGAGEGHPSAVGRPEHPLPGLQVAAVLHRPAQVAHNQRHRLLGHGPGQLVGGVADVGLHRVGQRVHAGGGGDHGRQAQGQLGIQHRAEGNQRKVIDGILVVGFAVGDDGGQGGLAAGTGGGGHGNEQRRGLQHLQQAPHFLQALARPGDARAHGLGAVHGGAAAHRDDGLAAPIDVPLAGRLHLMDGRVGGLLLNHHAGDGRLLQACFQARRQPQAAHPLIRHQQRGGNPVLPQHGNHVLHGAEGLGLPVGKQRQRQAEAPLKPPAVHRPEQLHP